MAADVLHAVLGDREAAGDLRVGCVDGMGLGWLLGVVAEQQGGALDVVVGLDHRWEAADLGEI